MPNHGYRRSVTTPDARDALDTNLLAILGLECADQRFGAKQGTADRIANPNCQIRRRLLPFPYDVEMVIKGCHLIHLSRRELQQICQRRKVRRGKMFISILNPVQALNKMIALQC